MYNTVSVSSSCNTFKILPFFFFLYSFPFLTSNVSACFHNFLSSTFPCKHSKILLYSSLDRKSTRLNSSHLVISYAVFCLKKKKNKYSSSLYLQCILI